MFYIMHSIAYIPGIQTHYTAYNNIIFHVTKYYIKAANIMNTSQPQQKSVTPEPLSDKDINRFSFVCIMENYVFRGRSWADMATELADSKAMIAIGNYLVFFTLNQISLQK